MEKEIVYCPRCLVGYERPISHDFFKFSYVCPDCDVACAAISVTNDGVYLIQVERIFAKSATRIPLLMLAAYKNIKMALGDKREEYGDTRGKGFAGIDFCIARELYDGVDPRTVLQTALDRLDEKANEPAPTPINFDYSSQWTQFQNATNSTANNVGQPIRWQPEIINGPVVAGAPVVDGDNPAGFQWYYGTADGVLIPRHPQIMNPPEAELDDFVEPQEE